MAVQPWMPFQGGHVLNRLLFAVGVSLCVGLSAQTLPYQLCDDPTRVGAGAASIESNFRYPKDRVAREPLAAVVGLVNP